MSDEFGQYPYFYKKLPGMSQSILKDKSFAFALEINKLYHFLATEKKEYVMSKQLLRSGTSVGAMVVKQKMQKAKPILFTNLALHKKNVMRVYIAWNYFANLKFCPKINIRLTAVQNMSF